MNRLFPVRLGFVSKEVIPFMKNNL